MATIYKNGENDRKKWTDAHKRKAQGFLRSRGLTPIDIGGEDVRTLNHIFKRSLTKESWYRTLRRFAAQDEQQQSEIRSVDSRPSSEVAIGRILQNIQENIQIRSTDFQKHTEIAMEIQKLREVKHRVDKVCDYLRRKKELICGDIILAYLEAECVDDLFEAVIQ